MRTSFRFVTAVGFAAIVAVLFGLFWTGVTTTREALDARRNAAAAGELGRGRPLIERHPGGHVSWHIKPRDARW